MNRLLLLLFLAQTPAAVNISDPTYQSRKVTTTKSVNRVGLDINCLNCGTLVLADGGILISSVQQSVGYDGGPAWDVTGHVTVHQNSGQDGGAWNVTGLVAIDAGSSISSVQSGKWWVDAYVAFDGGILTAIQGPSRDGGVDWPVIAKQGPGQDGGAWNISGTVTAALSGPVQQGVGFDGGTSWSVSGGTNYAPLITTPPISMIGAFGAQRVVEESPEIHFEFVYNTINPSVVVPETFDGGTVTQANSHAVLQTGAYDGGYAEIMSRAVVKYVAGQGVLARWTAVFTSCVAGNRQEIGMANETDGLLFGCDGAGFGIIYRNAGVETFIPQASWNQNTMLAADINGGFILDPTKGNIYMSQYQWLGYGILNFFIANPSSGTPVLVHRVTWGNANTAVSMGNPSLSLFARTWNYAGNTSNVTLRTPSMSIIREGPPSTFGVRGSATALLATVGATEVPLFTIRNPNYFPNDAGSGTLNRIQVRTDYLTIQSNKDVVVRLKSNAVLDAGTAFSNFSYWTNCITVDTASTTVVNGTALMTFVNAGNATSTINFVGRELYLYPNDQLTATVQSSQTNATVSVSLNWLEEN
jgi:hypothetical protein